MAYGIGRVKLAARAVREKTDELGRALMEKLIERYIKPTYKFGGLITDKNTEFLSDPDYQRAYQAALRHVPKNHPAWGEIIQWQLHVVQWAASQAVRIEGDFVECGVNTGMYSGSLMEYLDFSSMQDRNFYLFDTFEGFVPELMSSSENRLLNNPKKYPPCYDFVVEAFSKFENVRIIKGAVPESLQGVDIDKVAYLSLDMNCAYPEEEALKYFWPKMVKGAVVVLDDYAWPKHENQKKAHDQFAKSVGASIMTVPTGQGIMVKL